jgi:hypothetical protein
MELFVACLILWENRNKQNYIKENNNNHERRRCWILKRGPNFVLTSLLQKNIEGGGRQQGRCDGGREEYPW